MLGKKGMETGRLLIMPNASNADTAIANAHNRAFSQFPTMKELCKGAIRHNVCSAEKDTKRSNNTLLRLVYFSAEQTLHH